MDGTRASRTDEAALGGVGVFLAKLVCLIAVLGLILACQGIRAGDVAVDGVWLAAVGAQDLAGGAGSDLAASYESAAGGITLAVSNTSAQWRVDVRRSDIDWPSALTLAIRRTSSGTGGSVSGGTSYLTVDTLDRQFITGSGDVTGIGLQEMIGGVSVAIPPGSYAATLIFTITEA